MLSKAQRDARRLRQEVESYWLLGLPEWADEVLIREIIMPRQRLDALESGR